MISRRRILLAGASTVIGAGCQSSPLTNSSSTDPAEVERADRLMLPDNIPTEGQLVAAASVAAPSIDISEDMNGELLDAITWLATNRGSQGYNKNAVFTEDLNYGGTILPATYGAETMCVAAVAEIMIRAINAYATSTGDMSVYDQMPSTMWRRARRTDFRYWLFRNSVRSNGGRDALTRFGLGEGVEFADAKPGDIVYFNRTNDTGHAAIFLSFLKADYEETGHYDDGALGFKYFSAQGIGRPDAGLAHRWAYFSGYVPSPRPDRKRDIGVIRSSDYRYLNFSRLAHPTRWRVREAIEKAEAEETLALARNAPNPNGDFGAAPMPWRDRMQYALTEIETESSAVAGAAFSGETID